MKRLLMLALLACWPAAALAQTEDPAAARALFRQGRMLLAKGDWNAGCPKFQASMQLYPSVGALLSIAECREHEGKPASAQAAYLKAELLNDKTPSPADRRAFSQAIAQRSAALAPRVPKLVIRVEPQPNDLRVQRNGTDVPLAALGTPLPVDPGALVVTASAPGLGARQELVLDEGETKTVSLQLTAAGSALVAPGGGGASRSRVRTAGWVVGGFGAAALIAGGTLGGLAIGKKNSAEPHCDGNDVCDQQGVDARAQAIAFARGSTAMFVIGGAALATGIVLVALPLATSEPATAIRVAPGGLSVTGSF